MSYPFMQRAIEMAVANVHSGRGGPFAALVVRKGEIIGTGTNLVTSTNDPTAHAEIVAIREACEEIKSFHLQGCELYTTCEPCPMCLGAIYWAHIARIYYGSTRSDAAEAGFDDDFIYREIERPPHLRRIQMIQLAHADAQRAFQAWADQEDRTRY